MACAIVVAAFMLSGSIAEAGAAKKLDYGSTTDLELEPPEEIVTLTLRPGWRGRKDRAEIHYAGFHFQLAKGWYTYWRSPGKYGVPLQVDWSGSRNMSGVEILWPTPTLIGAADVEVLGYRDTVILPLLVRPRRANKPVAVKAHLFFGICKEVCIPVMQSVT